MSDDNDLKHSFHAKVLETKQNKPGEWKSCRIGIFDGETQIGEYERNYGSFGESTFHPFKLGDRWLALYSRDYTSTRVMSLPDCTDLGGENRDTFGFCPTDYYVPILTSRVRTPGDDPVRLAHHDSEKWAHKVQQGGFIRQYWPDDKDHPEPDEARKEAYLKVKEETLAAYEAWNKRHPYSDRYATFGFVCGCVWGDDSGGWKVQCLDLSGAAQGVIKRDDRFGYIELSPAVELKDGVRVLDPGFFDDPPERIRINIAVPLSFNLAGKYLGHAGDWKGDSSG